MQTTNVPTRIEQPAFSDLSGMMAMLCSYEDRFGPYHPQTLALTTKLAGLLLQCGQVSQGGALLERVVRDARQYLAPHHEVRLKAVAALRDFLGDQQTRQ
jgi:hypothetical protein